MTDHSLNTADLTWLARLAGALLRDGHSAEDLVQETLAAALQNPPPDEVPPRAWLSGIAKRLAARHLRSSARRERREAVVARPERLPDSTELLERAETAELLSAAVRRLPEPYRRTILLRFMEGVDAKEIARREGKPTDTVRWRMRRGLEMLREELDQRHGGERLAWSVLLLPLTRFGGSAGHAAAGGTGVLASAAAVWMTMKTLMIGLVLIGALSVWWVASEDRETAKPVAPPAALVSSEVTPPTLASDETPAPLAVTDARPLDAPRDAPPAAEADTTPDLTGALSGRVLDAQGAPIPAATLYLLAANSEDSGATELATLVLSDETGGFQFDADALALPGSLGLGASANEFLRTVIPDISQHDRRDELVVRMERGLGLSGRVVDADGRGVPQLELLAHTAQVASIEHVSPSKMRLNAQRAELGGTDSPYHQGLARTDDSGWIDFSGLTADVVTLRSLDPGWTLDGPVLEAPGESGLLWRATPRLGVSVEVVHAEDGRPVELARGVFRVELGFDDGSSEDLGQWVGRGAGRMSLTLGAGSLPDFGARSITSARFYGLAKVGEASKLWEAEPIVDERGATGTAYARVAIAPDDHEEPNSEPSSGPFTDLELEVFDDGGGLFRDAIVVRWSVVDAQGETYAGVEEPRFLDGARERMRLPAGVTELSVRESGASGSLPPWTGEVRTEAESLQRLSARLPGGARATLVRPENWFGPWSVHASWRPREGGEWRGSWNYGTTEDELLLVALRPAEWRFRLSPDETSSQTPRVHEVLLLEGDAQRIDG